MEVDGAVGVNVAGVEEVGRVVAVAATVPARSQGFGGEGIAVKVEN